MSDENLIQARAITAWLGRAKVWLSGGLLIGAIAGFAVSFAMQPIYRAEVSILPSASGGAGGGLSGIVNQLGGLAGMAGLNLSAGGDNKAEAIAYLNSRAAIATFLQRHNLVSTLKANHFFRTPNDELNSAVRNFKRRVLTISEDRRTGTVTVAVDWPRPEEAAVWANGFVESVNDEMRIRAISEAESAIKYLTDEVVKTHVVDVQQTLYRLIEVHLNTVSTAKSRRDYAFRTVDVAVADYNAVVSPRKVLLAIGGGLLGALVGSLLFSVIAVRRRPVV